MDRASDYESAGRVFESPWARHTPRRVYGSPELNVVQGANYYEPCKVRGSHAPYVVHGAIFCTI